VPETVRFARSFLPSYSFLTEEVPWMTYKATAWLDRFLAREMSVFEYGSGGSTLFFANRVNKVVSVEHDADWHRQVSETMERRALTNCEYLLREPERAPADRPAEYRWDLYTSTDGDFAGFVFDAYVKSIARFPNGGFDLVVVDGRARPSCVHHGVPKVRPGGVLLLDDSDRPEYADAVDWLSQRPRTDFRGISPATGTLKQESAWRL
jgi:predicted O-methyltransferase YrrM